MSNWGLVPGTAIPEAGWVQEDGTVLARRSLPGPVVDASPTRFPAVFCATHEHRETTGLTLVLFGPPGQLTLVPFDDVPRFHCACDDGIVVGTADGGVSLILEDGLRCPLGQLDDAAATLLFSPLRDFFLSVNETGHHRRFQLYRLP